MGDVFFFLFWYSYIVFLSRENVKNNVSVLLMKVYGRRDHMVVCMFQSIWASLCVQVVLPCYLVWFCISIVCIFVLI